MLARDEADAIPGVAEACRGLYDSVAVMIDHRTRDDTTEAVHTLLGPRVASTQLVFKDFAQARNALFDFARAGLGADDWLLLVDPDSPPRGVLPDLGAGADVWDCDWLNGPLAYRLPILVRAGLDCAYVGACHELLDVPGAHTRGFAEGMRVVVPPKEHSLERMETYVELLKLDSDSNPRSAFYLARTLRDLDRRGEAIEAYLRRAQMGDAGWIEETFICLLDAGVLLIELDVDLAETLLRRASLFRPTRAEPLYHLAWIANWRGDYERAEERALAGLAIGASTDSLFVNRWIEGPGLLAELQRARAGLAVAEPSTMEPADGIPVHR